MPDPASPSQAPSAGGAAGNMKETGGGEARREEPRVSSAGAERMAESQRSEERRVGKECLL